MRSPLVKPVTISWTLSKVLVPFEKPVLVFFFCWKGEEMTEKVEARILDEETFEGRKQADFE